jgi:cytochrome c oxidase cbb3-type subunit 3
MKTKPAPAVHAASILGCAILASCTQHQAAAPAGATTDRPPGIQYEAHVSAGGRVPSGVELNNPLHGDQAAAKNGEALFSAMNCDGCHGGGASGWVGPSLADGRWRYGGADAEVFSSIYYGRPKGMPAFGGTISPTAVWSLVTYLKSLPPPTDVPTESWEE